MKEERGRYHNKTVSRNVYITPRDIIEDLGPFDLDVCGQPKLFRPWDIAKETYTEEDDGMKKVWPRESFIWMNPPYLRQSGYTVKDWMREISQHNNGFVCISVNPSTIAWQKYVFPIATGIFFFSSRVNFHKANGVLVDGVMHDTAIIAYGPKAWRRLVNYKGRSGTFISLNI